MNIRKQQLPGGEISLGFDKCRPEDAGEYTCTATNKHGTKSSSAPLKVISKFDEVLYFNFEWGKNPSSFLQSYIRFINLYTCYIVRKNLFQLGYA